MGGKRKGEECLGKTREREREPVTRHVGRERRRESWRSATPFPSRPLAERTATSALLGCSPSLSLNFSPLASPKEPADCQYMERRVLILGS